MPVTVGWLIAQAAPEGTSSSSILVTLAAVVGLATGVSAIFVSYRNSQSAAKKDYVQGNLDSLAAVNERLEAESDRLRARSETQRKRIAELEDELAATKVELKKVRQECDECLSRVEKLEHPEDPK